MKLPFKKGLFWTTLVIVFVLIVVAWKLILRYTDYEMIGADYGGSLISGVLFSYLVHLWMLPGEYDDEDAEEWEDEDTEDA